MGTKTAAIPRHEIPLQKDGRTELQELAAALSQHVERRHETRGAHTVEIVREPERFDLTVEPEPLPVREPEPLAAVVNRGVRRAVPLVFAALITGAVGVAGWTASHASAATHPSTTTSSHATTAPATTTPTTPADLGAAARQRLTTLGHPVDVFACQGAYAADGLPDAATHPDLLRAYLTACLSDMSGASVGRSG
jgi:hypothetical protein